MTYGRSTSPTGSFVGLLPASLQRLIQPSDDQPALQVVAKGASPPAGVANHLVEWVADAASFGTSPAFFLASNLGFFTPAFMVISPALAALASDATLSGDSNHSGMLSIWSDLASGGACIGLRGSGSANKHIIGYDRSGRPIVYHGEFGEIDRHPPADTLPTLTAGMLREISRPFGGWPTPHIAMPTGNEIPVGTLVGKRCSGRITSGTGTVSSSTYAALPGSTSLLYKKRGSSDETELLITIRATVTNATAAGQATVGVACNSTADGLDNYDVATCGLPITGTTDHRQIVGTAVVTDRSAGDQTISIVWKTSGGSEVVTSSTDDFHEITVEEVIKQSDYMVARDAMARTTNAAPRWSDSGHLWNGIVGTWTIQSGKIQQTGSGGNTGFLELTSVGESDIDLSVAITTGNNGGNNYSPGVFFRYTNTSNYWRARLMENPQQVELLSVVSGAAETTATTAMTITKGATYTLRVVAKANAIKVYVDGVEKISQTGLPASLETNTKLGFMTDSTDAAVGTTASAWDNLTIKRRTTAP